MSARSAGADKLTRRERRRRVILLVCLLIVLLVAGIVALRFTKDSALPSIAMLDPEQAVAPPHYLFSISGTGRNALNRPTGVAIAPNGDVYAVDFGNQRVVVFTRTGDFKYAFGKLVGQKAKTLGAPVNLEIVGNEVWVTDRRLQAVFIFGMDGKYKRRWMPSGLPDARFSPLALTVRGDDVLLTDVGNTAKHRLVYAKLNGTVIRAVGSSEQAKQPELSTGKFMFPSGLALGSDGRIYVSDGNNRRVQVFDRNGKFLQIVNTSGVPRGIDLDAKNRLYVVDTLAHMVGVYDSKGNKLTEFGSQGFGPGQFNFPNDVAIGADNRIYITDRENDQIQVWEWPAIAVPSPTAFVAKNPWVWSLLLLLLLPLIPLLRRRRRWVVTPDFVESLIEAGRASILTDRRSLFVAPEFDAERYAGRVEGVVNLGDVIRIEGHSVADARVFSDRYGATDEQAAYLTMAERAKGLLTDDEALTSLAASAEVRVRGSIAFSNTVAPATEGS